MILSVEYQCHGCKLPWTRVTVRHRHEGENILKWMDDVRRYVFNDHYGRSPGCKEGKCDLRIPVAGDGPIGGHGTEASRSIKLERKGDAE